MKTLRKNQVGLSVASLLPLAAVPLFGNFFIKWVFKSGGFDYLQMLPVSNVSPFLLDIWGIQTKYVERAWNPSTLVKHLRNVPGDSGISTRWHDVLFFPKPVRANYKYYKFLQYGAWPIQHSIKEWRTHKGGEIEIHEGLGTVKDILAIPEEINLVFDTKHAGIGFFGMHETFNEIDLFEIVKSRIGHIHVQPKNRNEMRIFGHPLEYLLRHMAKDSTRKNLNWTLEWSPAWYTPAELLNPRFYFRTLTQAKQRVTHIINNP